METEAAFVSFHCRACKRQNFFFFGRLFGGELLLRLRAAGFLYKALFQKVEGQF
jgi:hypothetical protein